MLNTHVWYDNFKNRSQESNIPRNRFLTMFPSKIIYFNSNNMLDIPYIFITFPKNIIFRRWLQKKILKKHILNTPKVGRESMDWLYQYFLSVL